MHAKRTGHVRHGHARVYDLIGSVLSLGRDEAVRERIVELAAPAPGETVLDECVFEKMGIAEDELGNPGTGGSAPERIHLYHGGSPSGRAGTRIDGNRPDDTDLYSDLVRMRTYAMVVADCEGGSWDGNGFDQRDAVHLHPCPPARLIRVQ